MKLFPAAHATHPQWHMAVGLVLAQLRAQMALPRYANAPRLGLLYMTDHCVPSARPMLDMLRKELPMVNEWAGTVGVGIAANNAEYFDEPALSVMLCELPTTQYQVFSGVAPLDGLDATVSRRNPYARPLRASMALVHADDRTHDLPELLVDLAARTQTGYLFGGLSSSRSETLQFASIGSLPNNILSGGLSGVAFGEDVPIISRVTQGCQPISREYAITESEGNLLLSLDGEPALDVLLRELAISLEAPQEAIEAVRATLVGLGRASSGVPYTGHLGTQTLVRHIIGLDPVRRGIAIADDVPTGLRLCFCRRNAQTARADLMRICAEIREELEPQEQALEIASAVAAGETDARPHPARRIAGAVYVSCMGRGGAHFGAPGAELQIVRHALGDVPLVGFFAGGEIAGHHLHGYTGVLTVFVAN